MNWSKILAIQVLVLFLTVRCHEPASTTSSAGEKEQELVQNIVEEPLMENKRFEPFLSGDQYFEMKREDSEGRWKKFDPYSKRFDLMDKRFDPYSKRFDPYSKRFDPYSKRFDPHSKRFDPFVKRFDYYSEIPEKKFDPKSFYDRLWFFGQSKRNNIDSRAFQIGLGK